MWQIDDSGEPISVSCFLDDTLSFFAEGIKSPWPSASSIQYRSLPCDSLLTMLLFFTQILFAALLLDYLRRRFVRNPVFANIPGPPKKSWWKGTLLPPSTFSPRPTHPQSTLGCFDQVFDFYGWNFHLGIIGKYGSVVKLPMLFGVSYTKLALSSL